jgi:membrane-bound lytic murein transglycosylase B
MNTKFVLVICLLLAPLRAEAQQDPLAIITAVSRTYQVPAGILYGIWRKESGMLMNGWRTKAGDWFNAGELVSPGGRCVTEYGQARCQKHWAALVAICAQRHRNGAITCDPRQVYTSYALAMGPMQHMPAELIKWTASGWQWTGDAIDFDRDGVVDPHNLADAMAMTAVQIRRYHDKNPNQSWRWAVNRYYGSQKAAYYAGQWEASRKGQRFRYGVKEYWASWCQYRGCHR